MNLIYYKDQTEKDLRINLEELIEDAEYFYSLAEESEDKKVKELYLKKARDKKAEIKWLVKTYYEKTPSNKLLDSITQETVQAQKSSKTKTESNELRRLAHIKNLIRKGKWISTKKPTIVKAEEFSC